MRKSRVFGRSIRIICLFVTLIIVIGLFGFDEIIFVLVFD